MCKTLLLLLTTQIPCADTVFDLTWSIRLPVAYLPKSLCCKYNLGKYAMRLTITQCQFGLSCQNVKYNEKKMWHNKFWALGQILYSSSTTRLKELYQNLMFDLQTFRFCGEARLWSQQSLFRVCANYTHSPLFCIGNAWRVMVSVTSPTAGRVCRLMFYLVSE